MWDVKRVDPARQARKAVGAAESGMSRRHRAAAPRARRGTARAAVHARALGRHDAARPPTAAAAPPSPPARRAALAHALRAPGQLGIGRAYVSGALEVDDLDAALELLDELAAAAARPQPAGAAGARGRARAGGVMRPPPVPASELRPRGAAPQHRPRPACGAPPLRRLERLLRALPRRLDDLQLRDLLARRTDARGGAGDQARAGLHEARRSSPASACSTSAAAGAASRSTPPRDHGVRVTGITLSENQAAAGPPAGRRAGPRRPRRDPRRRLPRARRRAVRRDRQHRHGRARRREPDRPLRAPARAHAAAGRAAAQPRHRAPAPRRPRGGPVLRALRVPRRRAAAPVADRARARARRPAGRPRRGLRRPTTPTTLSPLGAALRRAASTRPCASPAPSACASSGSTCARRATAS